MYQKLRPLPFETGKKKIKTLKLKCVKQKKPKIRVPFSPEIYQIRNPFSP